MKNVTGTSVSGTDFFGRELELRSLSSAVKDGNHVLLSAPRRIGKTSLVLRLVEVLKEEGWRSFRCDVQAITTEKAFFIQVTQALEKEGIKLPGGYKFSQGFDAVKQQLKGSKAKAAGVEVELGGDLTDWIRTAETLEKVLTALPDTPRTLIAIDELPIFLARLAKADRGAERVLSVLNYLRRLRDAGGKRVTWIVCGSIGLDTFVEQRGLSGTINDFQIQTLGAFSDALAITFLQRLAESTEPPFTLTDEVCTHCLKQVGWPLPYYLQLLFHSLKELPQQRTADFPRTVDIDAAYAALLQPHHDTLFAHWHSRLEEQFEDPSELRIAHELLKQLCIKPRGIKRETLIATLQARFLNSDTEQIGQQTRQILNILERDGYLLRSPNETISFRSFLLRDFWKRRYA